MIIGSNVGVALCERRRPSERNLGCAPADVPSAVEPSGKAGVPHYAMAKRFLFGLAWLCNARSLVGCTSTASESTSAGAGIAGAAIAHGLTHNAAAITTGIGVGVEAATRPGLQYTERKIHQAEQDRIAALEFTLWVGPVGRWQVEKTIPLEAKEPGEVSRSSPGRRRYQVNRNRCLGRAREAGRCGARIRHHDRVPRRPRMDMGHSRARNRALGSAALTPRPWRRPRLALCVVLLAQQHQPP